MTPATKYYFKQICTECWGRGRKMISTWNVEGQKVEEKDLGVCPACGGAGHHGYQTFDAGTSPEPIWQEGTHAVVG